MNYSDAIEMLETHDYRPILKSKDGYWDQFTFYFWTTVYDLKQYLLNQIGPKSGHKMSELFKNHLTWIFHSLFILILDRLNQSDLADKYQERFF